MDQPKKIRIRITGYREEARFIVFERVDNTEEGVKAALRAFARHFLSDRLERIEVQAA